MRKTLLTLLVSAAALVAGCQSQPKDHVVTELSPQNLRATWTRTLTLDGAQPRAMFTRGDALLIYTSDNVLYRMNRKSGDVAYLAKVADRGVALKAPAMDGENVIVPTDMTLEYFDQKGFKVKTIKLPDPIRSGIALDKTVLYAGIDSGRGGARIACIDPSRPNSPYRWELRTNGVVVGRPAVYEGILFAGSDDGSVYAVDSDRAPAWGALGGAFKTAGPIHGDVTADKSGVYVASADSKVYCLDRRDGKVKWQYYSGTPLFDSPAVTETSVYINVRGQGVAAMDKGDGEYNRKARWIVPNTSAFLAEDDQYAFLRGAKNNIVAVDKKTGEVKFTSMRDDLAAFATNTADGTIYAATKKGRIIAAVAVKRHGEIGELVWMESAEAATLN